MGKFALNTLLLLFPLLGFAQPDTMWTATIDSSNIELVSVIPFGGYYVSGYSLLAGNSGYAVWRLTTDGHVIWKTLFDDSLSHVSTNSEIITAPDSGCVLLAGWGYWGTALLKLSQGGDIEWTYILSPDGYETPYSVISTTNGGFLIAGWYREDNEDMDTGTFIKKLTANGEAEWDARIRHIDGRNFGLIHEAINGNLLVLFSVHAYYLLGYELHILEAESGRQISSIEIDSYEHLIVQNLSETIEGDFSISGIAQSYGNFPRICFTKTNSNGDVLETCLGDTILAIPNSWDDLSSEESVFAGYTYSPQRDSCQFYLSFVSDFCSIQWTRVYCTDPTYESRCAIKDNDDGILIVGYSDESDKSLIVKTNPILDADDLPKIQPSSYDLHPCYPNPFNPTTTISFDLTHPGLVKLNIFDITGRQISTLIEDNMTAGQHQIMFDGSGLASGIYFARLEAGDFILSQKMILLK